MKKYLLFLILISFLNLYSQTSRINQPSKAIHIVYDDSNSMIIDNGIYNARWAYARYAMEVFAAMLETNDTMRIYYMYDFINNPRAAAGLVIHGSEPVSVRVQKVHNKVTNNSGTPFDPVIKAFDDIKGLQVDQKWLIILTDGEFNDFSNSNVERHYQTFSNERNMRIVHFAIGDDAATINPNHDRNIFLYHAKNDKDILNMITQVSNLIFSRNILKFTSENRGTFKFDTPMHDLIVFAQGENVNINNISGAEKRTPEDIVSVSYNPTILNDRFSAGAIRPDYLSGVIGTFYNLKKGSYKVDVSGAREIEIYYKPDVKLDIRLYPRSGCFLQRRKQIDNSKLDNLHTGKYMVRFGIVPSDWNKNRPDKFKSDFIRNPDINFTFNGETFTKTGSIIRINEGDFNISSNAIYSDINELEFSIQGHAKKMSLLHCIWGWWRCFVLLLVILLGYLICKDFKKRRMIAVFPRRFSDNTARISKVVNNAEVAQDLDNSFRSHNLKRNRGIFQIKGRYEPEKATISFVPHDFQPPLEMTVTAHANQTHMIVENIGSLRGEDNFRNYSVEEIQIPTNHMNMLSYNANITTIKNVNGNIITYTCYLAVE